VSLALGDRLLFDHQGAVARIPASNQKLLLSMALLDAFPVSSRIPTSAAARIDGPSIAGDLFVYGLGDPTFGDAAYRATLGLTGSTIDRLARQVAALGFEKVEGRVVGLRGALLGDWDAVGWRTKVARRYIARPTALSVNGNRASATAPERQAAAALTARLEELGVDVAGAPGRSTQPFPRRASSLGGVTSPPLIELIGIMARDSSNFIAEVLSKRLGAKCFGPPGTIASGARAITRWARMNGASIVANDASGLSYDNQISTRAMVGLMTQVRKRWWGGQLMRALPEPGQGTLAHRLEGLTMHAKTGSLFDGTSTLSGWVWLEREQHWAAFSIMSSLGDAGPALEDEIVRLVARTAAL
jgi:D-alanyl-D-alanine carboxypeptidase/D-alanyl-D-alanine-endopeptidase (penicillin-binding protein 4)